MVVRRLHTPFVAPQTRPFKEAISILRSPYLGGVLAAFFVVTHFWPAGFDARLYYLRFPPPQATTPIWIYLITYPLSFLGWPLSWQVLATVSVLGVGLAYAMRGNPRWWIVVFSAPVLYNAWWGQVEIFSVVGLMLGLLVLQKKVHPAWLGVAWLALSIKPQTNYGVLLLLTWWAWHELGWRKLLPAALVSLAVIAITLLIWPGWVVQLFSVYRSTIFGFANASIFPFGLAAWPLALIPLSMSPDRRLRMVAAASLLGSPYFTLHHCILLLLLTDSPAALLLSWLPMGLIFLTRDWAMFAWFIPTVILAIDLVKTLRESRQTPMQVEETQPHLP